MTELSYKHHDLMYGIDCPVCFSLIKRKSQIFKLATVVLADLAQHPFCLWFINAVRVAVSNVIFGLCRYVILHKGISAYIHIHMHSFVGGRLHTG